MTGPEIIRQKITGATWPTHNEARSTETVWARLGGDGELEKMGRPGNVTNPQEEHYREYAEGHGYLEVEYLPEENWSAVYRSRYRVEGGKLQEVAEPLTVAEARVLCASMVATFLAYVQQEPHKVYAQVAGEQVSTLWIWGSGGIPQVNELMPVWDAQGKIICPTSQQALALNAALDAYRSACEEENKQLIEEIMAMTDISEMETAMTDYCRRAKKACKWHMIP